MGLSGLDLDAEERRNLLRLLALGDQLKDLSLPPRQAIERKVGLGQRGRSDGRRDARAYVHPSPGHFVDRADEVRHPVVLQDESPTSRPEGFGKVLVPGVGSEQDGSRSGRVPNDLCHGVDPIHERHVEIQNGHLRTEVPRQPDRLDAVRGLPDDGKPLTLEEALQALADDDVVVGEDDSQRSSLGRRGVGLGDVSLGKVRTVICRIASQPSAPARALSDLMSARSLRSAATSMVRGVSTGSEDGKRLNGPPLPDRLGFVGHGFARGCSRQPANFPPAMTRGRLGLARADAP